ncbi:MAG TPA: M20/M25/M40 family metallo-hydrolase [Candidatus Dojkabacteria bacterium]
MQKIVDTFFQIVKIDSPSGEEMEIKIYLKSWLERVGYKVKEDKVGNLLAYVYKGQPKLLLCAHMDTVMPGRSIKPQIRSGVIVSDGNTILGADNKASISAIICAVEDYLSVHGSLPDVEILFSVKEETGGGVEYFPFDWVKSKFGVTFDHAKPLGIITLAAPFIYNFRIIFLGKPAHSSKPEKGENALNAAIEFLKSLKVGAHDNHQSTINVGKISGGAGINVIPEEVIVEGEVRSTIKKRFDFHLKKVKSLAEKSVKGSRVKIKYSLDGFCPGYYYKKTDPFIKKVEKLLKKSRLTVGYDMSTGVSDVNSLVGGGIKAVCLSDGTKNPHTKKESVSIKNLESLYRLIYKMIEGFCLGT